MQPMPLRVPLPRCIIQYHVNILCENSLDPYVTDHIFYNDLTPEEVVEKIISYKPKRKRTLKKDTSKTKANISAFEMGCLM